MEYFVEPEGFFAPTVQAQTRSRDSSNPLFRVQIPIRFKYKKPSALADSFLY